MFDLKINFKIFLGGDLIKDDPELLGDFLIVSEGTDVKSALGG